MIEYRGYKIEPDGTYGHKVIRSFKGALPNSLKGTFTTYEFAKRAINLVVDEKGAKYAPTTITT